MRSSFREISRTRGRQRKRPFAGYQKLMLYRWCLLREHLHEVLVRWSLSLFANCVNVCSVTRAVVKQALSYSRGDARESKARNAFSVSLHECTDCLRITCVSCWKSGFDALWKDFSSWLRQKNCAPKSMSTVAVLTLRTPRTFFVRFSTLCLNKRSRLSYQWVWLDVQHRFECRRRSLSC